MTGFLEIRSNYDVFVSPRGGMALVVGKGAFDFYQGETRFQVPDAVVLASGGAVRGWSMTFAVEDMGIFGVPSLGQGTYITERGFILS